MGYRYQLDMSSKKFICPNCSKKRFVRYLDIESGQYCTEEFGRCDREVKCGYYRVPDGEVKYMNTNREPLLPPYYISTDNFRKTLLQYYKNNLFLFMIKWFGEKETKDVFHRYRVGTSKCWEGATLFWQINYKGQIGQGKIMVFDKETGKRIKEPFPLISSVHAQLGMQDRKPEYCLFGEHLLKFYPNKPVAVVESEKTALVMTLIESGFLWIASGGLSQLSKKRLSYLMNRKVVFYPDLGAFDSWSKKATELNKLGFSIKVSTLLEEKATLSDKVKGFDIADYYLNKYYNKPKPSDKLKTIISKYPSLEYLVDSLGLIPYE